MSDSPSRSLLPLPATEQSLMMPIVLQQQAAGAQGQQAQAYAGYGQATAQQVCAPLLCPPPCPICSSRELSLLPPCLSLPLCLVASPPPFPSPLGLLSYSVLPVPPPAVSFLPALLMLFPFLLSSLLPSWYSFPRQAAAPAAAAAAAGQQQQYAQQYGQYSAQQYGQQQAAAAQQQQAAYGTTAAAYQQPQQPAAQQVGQKREADASSSYYQVRLQCHPGRRPPYCTVDMSCPRSSLFNPAFI